MSSPISTLPSEVLSRVFCACLPRNREILAHQNRAPLLLASVCGEWRAVALATAQLWRSIFMTLSPQYEGISTLFGEPTPTQDALAAMSQWISRAGALPLSIGISSDARLPRGLLVLLQRFSHRIEELNLELDDPNDIAEFCAICTPFLVLRRLVISTLPTHVLNCVPQPVQNAPKLRELAVPNSRWVDMRCPPFDLHSLFLYTHTQTQDPYTYTAALFKQFPGLRHLKTLFFQPYLDPPSSEDWEWPWPGLTSLIVQGSIKRILPVITFGSLQHLQVRIFAVSDVDLLADSLVTSTCELAHLSVETPHSIGVQQEYIDAERYLLFVLPTLRSLELSLTYLEQQKLHIVGDGRIRSLIATADNLELLPRLEFIFVTDEVTSIQTFEAFASLLESRAMASLRFGRLCIYPRWTISGPNPPKPLLLRLNALRNSGLDVQIHTPALSWPFAFDDGDAPENIQYPCPDRPGTLRPVMAFEH